MRHVVTARFTRNTSIGYPPSEKGTWIVAGENNAQIVDRAIAAARRDGCEHIIVTHIDGQAIAGRDLGL